MPIGVHAVQERIGADVRGQDDDRVLEIDRAALSVGDAAVVQHLQKHVQHVRMRLFDLVEQHDRVRLSADRLGELPALVVADVSRRCADQTRHGVLLHVFAHVDAHHVALAVKQRLGQRLAQLGLADAGGAEEQERADRPVRVLDARARPEDRVAHALHRVVLSDDALMQHFVEVQQLFPLAFEELGHRNAGPARHDLGDLLLGDVIAQQRVLLRRVLRLGFLERLLQLRQLSVLQLRRLVQVVRVFGRGDLVADGFDLFAQRLHLGDLGLFGLPLRLHRVERVALLGKLLLDLLEMRFGLRIVVLL